MGTLFVLDSGTATTKSEDFQPVEQAADLGAFREFVAVLQIAGLDAFDNANFCLQTAIERKEPLFVDIPDTTVYLDASSNPSALVQVREFARYVRWKQVSGNPVRIRRCLLYAKEPRS